MAKIISLAEQIAIEQIEYSNRKKEKIRIEKEIKELQGKAVSLMNSIDVKKNILKENEKIILNQKKEIKELEKEKQEKECVLKSIDTAQKKAEYEILLKKIDEVKKEQLLLEQQKDEIIHNNALVGKEMLQNMERNTLFQKEYEKAKEDFQSFKRQKQDILIKIDQFNTFLEKKQKNIFIAEKRLEDFCKENNIHFYLKK